MMHPQCGETSDHANYCTHGTRENSFELLEQPSARRHAALHACSKLRELQLCVRKRRVLAFAEPIMLVVSVSGQ